MSVLTEDLRSYRLSNINMMSGLVIIIVALDLVRADGNSLFICP